MDGIPNKLTSRKQKQLNPWSSISYMVALAWHKQKSVLVLCVLLAVLSVGGSLAELYVAPAILRRVEAATPLSELLWTIAVFSMLLILLKGAYAYVNNQVLFGRVTVRTEILMGIHNKLANTSFPNTEDATVLKKLDKARYTLSGNSRAGEAIWTTITDVLKSLIGFGIYLALLSSVDPFLIVVTITTTALGYFINLRINSWGYRHREEEEGYIKRMDYASHAAEDIKFSKDIRIFNIRPWMEKIYSSTLRLYQAFMARREKVYIWANIVDVLLALLRNGIAYAYLISMTLQDGLSASQFLLYFSAVGGFTTWVTGILSGFSTMHQQCLDLVTVREFLKLPELFQFEDGKPLEPVSNKPYEIRLKDVSFRYSGAEKDTLHHLNLTIRPGEKLAVVGLNGAGKTTLVKLICGFYDPTEGEVLLNGENIKQYNRYDYYRHFSAVFQEFSLLDVTLAENVAQTDVGIDMERVRNCVAQAGLTAKVESLPNGYQTHIGREVFEDGIELSGGETQRLMLARALYKDAPVIVLDEPTAALDPISENDIYLTYHELTHGRSSVYISHRLTSTRFCDRIILVADGGIAEEGTHDSLLAAGGRYAELFEIQSRYYKEGRNFDDEEASGR